MNVKELIDALNNIDNKDKEVYIYYNDDIHDIDIIDDISDRVDINIF